MAASTENTKDGRRPATVGRLTALAIILALAAGVLYWATQGRRANIIKTANALGGCSTFVDLVDKAGMTTVLEKDGPFTVFIPTNAAFAKIPKERLERVLNDKSALAALLLYHMTPRALTVQDLATASEQPTCVVPPTNVVCSQDKYGDAVCVEKNIPCVNGVVYVIDSVQFPPFLKDDKPTPTQPAADDLSIVAEETTIQALPEAPQTEPVPTPTPEPAPAENPTPAPEAIPVDNSAPATETVPAENPAPTAETAPIENPTPTPTENAPEAEPAPNPEAENAPAA